VVEEAVMVDLAKKEKGYDSSLTLRLRGVGGLLDGEVRTVRVGESVVVGRSRHCDFSLKKTRAFLLAGDRARIRDDPRFRRVSRRHVRISFVNEAMVEVEDLSRNGTLMDGRRVDRRLLLDVAVRKYRVDLGGGHAFEICWGEPETVTAG
jgi:pSer/pThr/pTyr-binding forkhead associated (FHA) protein